MSPIKPKQLESLRCMSCEHYRFDEYKQKHKQHRCTYFTTFGTSILNADYNVSSHTPNYCPFVTPKDIAITKGTAIAKKIGIREKKLQEAEMLVATLPKEIEQLYAALEEVLTSVNCESSDNK